MSEPLKFEPRKTVNERLKDHLTQSEDQLKAVVNNEGITRTRVDSIERVLGGFLGLSLRHRLKWLIFGMPLPPHRKPEPEKDGPDVH